MKKFLAEFRASWNLIIEYRVMVLIWMLTIVLPLIMLAVWLSIAAKGAVQGYDRSTFISYYLAALVVRNGKPASEILAYIAEHHDIGLVVMATTGRGGVARFMMGSVTDKVVRAAPCPVLTLHPNDRVEEQAPNRAA